MASVSSTLLTAAVDTNVARVQGTVEETFRTSYDLLVRPPGTQTRLEAERDLVRNNVESGIYGGITNRQWRAVLGMPGVEVAAPVAYLGHVMALVQYEVQLGSIIDGQGEQFFRIRATTVAENGLSRYPGPVDYLYVPGGRGGCANLAIEGPIDGSPFGMTGRQSGGLRCVDSVPRSGSVEAGQLTYSTGTVLPLLTAAVDPVEENKLLGLDSAVVSGTPLDRDDSFDRVPLGARIPALASRDSYLRESLELSIERVRVPAGADPQRRLFDPARARGEYSAPPNRGWRWAHRLSSAPVGRTDVSPAAFHRAFLNQGQAAGAYGFFVPFSSYVSAGNPHHQQLASQQIRPRIVPDQSFLVWSDQAETGVPQSNRDVQLRPLTAHNAVEDSLGAGQSEIQVVGEFDPDQLPGFDPLNRVPLETYFPPTVTAGDEQTARMLGGQPLGPSWNVGGYVATPPALLTTLEAARGMVSTRFFTGTSFAAPISVIRVRVEGVTGPDDESLARIERVATLISQDTGLTVDVTAGSSPEPQTVVLPAGKFGRPELVVEEGWAKKGVALVILSAVDRKSVLLLGLVLLVTAGFLTNAALASVRTRRQEIGALLCVGWSRRSIVAAVLAELAAVGAIAGLVGAVLAVGLVVALDLEVPPSRVLFIPLVAVALTATAGVGPAWLASRGQPIDVVQPAVSGRTGGRATRHLLALAWANLRRRPGRALLAGLGLCLGIAAVTALMALNLAFQGSVAGNLLGDYVAVQVRSVDYVSVGLATGLAAFSLADVLVLNLRERAAEIATLQAGGWADRHVAALSLLEALLIGVSASVVGAGLGAAVGAALGGPAQPLLVTAGLAVLVGITVTLLAAAVPSRLAVTGAPALVLAGE